MPTQFKVGHCPIGDMHASRDKILYTAFKFESAEGYDKQMLKVCINIYIYIYIVHAVMNSKDSKM